MERFKARLVAQGFSQKPGIDYDETFSPVARFESVRTVIALAVQNDLKLHQIDVTTAFLNGDLKDAVYMKQPEGFVVKGQEHLVCKLKRSIYFPIFWELKCCRTNKMETFGLDNQRTPKRSCANLTWRMLRQLIPKLTLAQNLLR